MPNYITQYYKEYYGNTDNPNDDPILHVDHNPPKRLFRFL